MRTLLPIRVGLLLISAAQGAWAADPPVTADPRGSPVVVLPGSDDVGSFTVSVTDDGASLAIATGDGARLVARDTLLVIAGEGARLRFPPGGADAAAASAIEPLDGPLRLVAGSVGARLDLSGFSLDLLRSELLLVRQGTSWALLVVAVAEGGGVMLHLSPPPSAPAATDGQLGVEIPGTAGPPRNLAPGESLALAAGPAPGRVAPTAAALLVSVARRLPMLPPVRSGPQLRPIAIEDPADFSTAGSRGGSGDAAIEIEAVEVEIGCVEVCVD
jgi:hypothetical protein